MTVAYDFAQLQEDHGLEVLLADHVLVRSQQVVCEPCSGFSAVGGGRLRVHLWDLRGEDNPGLAVLVEGSSDGVTWEAIVAWSFLRGDATEVTEDVVEPADYMRVTITPGGGLRDAHVSVGFVPSYLDVPGGGGTPPGDREPTWGTTWSTQIIAPGPSPHVMASTTNAIEPLTAAEIAQGYTQEVLVEAWAYIDNATEAAVQSIGIALRRGNMPPVDGYGSFDSGQLLNEASPLDIELGGSAEPWGHRAFLVASAQDFNPVGEYAQLRVTKGDVMAGGASMLLKALEPGMAGNAMSFRTLGGAGSHVLAVQVVGLDITVQLATAGGVPTSTFDEVRDAINAHPAASALLVATNDAGNPDIQTMDVGFYDSFLEGVDTVYYTLWTDGSNTGTVYGFAGIRTTTRGIAP